MCFTFRGFSATNDGDGGSRTAAVRQGDKQVKWVGETDFCMF